MQKQKWKAPEGNTGVSIGGEWMQPDAEGHVFVSDGNYAAGLQACGFVPVEMSAEERAAISEEQTKKNSEIALSVIEQAEAEAAQMKSKAEAQAAEISASAESKATELLSSAEEKAAEILQKAQDEAAQLISEAKKNKR